MVLVYVFCLVIGGVFVVFLVFVGLDGVDFD